MNHSRVRLLLISLIIIESVIIGILSFKLFVVQPSGGTINIDSSYLEIAPFELEEGVDNNQYVLQSSISLDPTYHNHYVETNTSDGINTVYNNYYKVVIYFGTNNPSDFDENFQYIEWNISYFSNLFEIEFVLERDNLPDEVETSFDAMLNSTQQYEYMKILIYDSGNRLIYTLNTYIEDAT